MGKIEKELAEFKKFKSIYKFEQKEIKEIDGKLYCDDFPLEDENGKATGECEKWIDVGYKHHGAYTKALSNLFPYEFKFRNKKLNSIESFFQGIKFKDLKMQNLIFAYSGLDSNNVKVCSGYDWKKTGIVYWQGKEIVRQSREYDELVDELYISAIQNPLYRNLLRTCEKDIIHSIGEKEPSQTVFTRYEFERQLNCLKDFLKR